jgi:hypothetical protein
VVHKRIGAPLKSNGTPYGYGEPGAPQQTVNRLTVTTNATADLFYRLEASAVDNFTQLCFVQLLVIKLNYRLTFLGAHLGVFNAFGGLKRFGN